GLLLGLTTAGAAVYSTTALSGTGDGEAKRVRVPSPQNGILLAVGTEVKKGAPGPTFQLRIGKEVRAYRRLRVGDRVEKGQMLAQLDDRRAYNEVAQAEAKFELALADHQAARAMAS